MGGLFGKMTVKGGKMDDITVVVGMVVETAKANDLAEAVKESDELDKSMKAFREVTKVSEARTEAIVGKRDADKAKAARIQAEEDALTAGAVAAGRLPSSPNPQSNVRGSKPQDQPGAGERMYSDEAIELMDKKTVWQVLEANGLPTAGKLSKLKMMVAQIK